MNSTNVTGSRVRVHLPGRSTCREHLNRDRGGKGGWARYGTLAQVQE